MKVFAIRAEPALGATVETGIGYGLEIEGYPLSRVDPVLWETPPVEDFDGLLVGSANAFRHGGPALSQYERLPVLAVGETTAAIANMHGFTVEKTGDGGLQQLLDGLDGTPRRLLRLTGERNVDVVPPEGIEIAECVVYRTIEVPIDEEFAAKLAHKSLILLYSAGAAAHFAQECDRLAINRGKLSVAALGPRILDAAGGGWGDARYAEEPNENALLALAREMCHEM